MYIKEDTVNAWIVNSGAIKIDAERLLNALTSAAAFADKNLPNLAGVLIETREDTLTIAATDRYTLFIADMPAVVSGNFSLMLDNTAALIQLLKLAKNSTVTITAGGGVFTVSAGVIENKFPASEYQFPASYRDLMGDIPAEYSGVKTPFDPTLIAKIGKIKLAKNSPSVQLSITAKGQLRGGVEVPDKFRYDFIIMPKRV